MGHHASLVDVGITPLRGFIEPLIARCNNFGLLVATIPEHEDVSVAHGY